MTKVVNPFDHPATQLSFAVFRANGAFVGFGDRLGRPLGLTSARWQVMGAVRQAEGALPVASIARNMGLVRQSVQRVVDELVGEELARLVDNPHHRRAKLVQLTAHGDAKLDEINARWMQVADQLLSDSSPEDVARTKALLINVRDRLEAQQAETHVEDEHAGSKPNPG